MVFATLPKGTPGTPRAASDHLIGPAGSEPEAVTPLPSTIELDQLPIGVILVEPGGAVAAINETASSLFGQAPGALVASYGPALVQLSPERWRALRDAVARDGKATLQVALVLPRGNLRVQLIASPATHDGWPLVQLLVLEDTVSASRPQDAVRAAAPEQAPVLQRLDSLGLVAGGIAHDFNNLLVGVLAEASAVREEPNLGISTREALRRIEAAAERMSLLTKQLLAYAGRGRFVTMRLDPDGLLGDLREELARIVQHPVMLDVAPGAAGVVVEADPALLRQVVINLVINANDARGRRVQVASRMLSRDNAPWWQLEVSDDGAGIEPATLARIFDPFFSTKDDRHGLGLSAVHGIVRRLGGDIEVDSQPGHGARFRVRLPIVPGAEPAPRPKVDAAAPAPRLAGVRVLVADDEPSVRSTVRRLLERRGAAVVVAADGLEAEARIRDERFDLVVADVTMPGRNGYDVLAFARAHVPELPVVLMSGYTARSQSEAGEDQPDAFLEKPFTAKQLDAMIDEVMGPS